MKSGEIQRKMAKYSEKLQNTTNMNWWNREEKDKCSQQKMALYFASFHCVSPLFALFRHFCCILPLFRCISPLFTVFCHFSLYFVTFRILGRPHFQFQPKRLVHLPAPGNQIDKAIWLGANSFFYTQTHIHTYTGFVNLVTGSRKMHQALLGHFKTNESLV